MSKSPCILIVDDNHDNVKLLEEILEDEDYDTLTAYDGHEALDVVRDEMPDLILLDVMMPGVDGFEVCKIIKSDDKTQYIPVIFMSAKTDTLDKVEGLELGATDYIEKPFEIAEVIARVDTQINLKMMHEKVLKYHQTLLHSQRTTYTNTLARGMLHNFNNLMSGISGHAQLLQLELSDENDKIAEMVEKILQVVDRVNNLIRKFQNLLHKEKVSATSTKIENLIDDVVGLFSEISHSNIEVESELSPELPEIIVNRSRIIQALSNILTNAQEAMPDGGTVNIKSSVRPLPTEPAISVGGEIADEYVVISISDTGIGMDEETRQQAIDPFFTTKLTVGVGLGLSVAYSIVNNHKGAIDIQSEVSKGTTVLIYLPVES